MSDADEKAPSSVWAEAECRTSRYREGLERIRREHGLWVGGEDGEPRWLPPGPPQARRAARMRARRSSSTTMPRRPPGSSRGARAEASPGSACSASSMLLAW